MIAGAGTGCLAARRAGGCRTREAVCVRWAQHTTSTRSPCPVLRPVCGVQRAEGGHCPEASSRAGNHDGRGSAQWLTVQGVRREGQAGPREEPPGDGLWQHSRGHVGGQCRPLSLPHTRIHPTPRPGHVVPICSGRPNGSQHPHQDLGRPRGATSSRNTHTSSRTAGGAGGARPRAVSSIQPWRQEGGRDTERRWWLAKPRGGGRS